MTKIVDDIDDADVPAQAVAALNAAQKRAMDSGHTLVFVRGDLLIEKSVEGERVLKVLPPAPTVSDLAVRVQQ